MKKMTWLGLRLVMGLIFLWAFVDKLLGLGFATAKENAWINGGSPTSGFLLNATRGPLAEFFKGLAGVTIVDWVFMLGLAFVGLTLLFNRYVKSGAIAGSTMLVLMWLAVFPPANNPLLDEHIVYVLVLILLAFK
ncbi:MAG: hypothetical protein HYT68_00680, partial [Candidatus Zambryskibacteria bacterium]|nr:hypothetical protein [Candidatus Zambryskibacteria bacterium]